MGCGGSKCDPHADSLPAKLHPLLLRRLDEIRRRSRNGVFSNPLAADISKKELFKGVIFYDDNSTHQHDALKLRPNSDQSEKKPPANVVNVDGDDYKAANSEAQPPSPSTPRSPKVAPEPEPLPEKLLKKISNKKPDQELCITVDASVAGDRFRDDILYPGSPSFRFYFTESIFTDKDEDYDLDVDHSDKEHDDSDKISHTDLSSTDVDSINSDLTKSRKKKRRVHRLRKVIPMRKTLLNVRSCYNPCGRRQDDASLLRQKIPHSI